MNDKMQEYEKQLATEVTISPNAVSNRIHQTMYGPDTEHHSIHSCPCNHLALFYLGVRDSTGLFWPDDKGKNKWKV